MHSRRVGQVTIGLLGGFSASTDGVSVPDGAWRLRKARELVKLLALARGHRLHREQAMDALWPELDPAAAALQKENGQLEKVLRETRDEARKIAADIQRLKQELKKRGKK